MDGVPSIAVRAMIATTALVVISFACTASIIATAVVRLLRQQRERRDSLHLSNRRKLRDLQLVEKIGSPNSDGPNHTSHRPVGRLTTAARHHAHEAYALLDNMTLLLFFCLVVAHLLTCKAEDVLDIWQDCAIYAAYALSLAARVIIPISSTVFAIMTTLRQTSEVHKTRLLIPQVGTNAAAIGAVFALQLGVYLTSGRKAAAVVSLTILALSCASTTFVALRLLQMLPNHWSIRRKLRSTRMRVVQQRQKHTIRKAWREHQDTLLESATQATKSSAGTRASSSNPYHSLKCPEAATIRVVANRTPDEFGLPDLLEADVNEPRSHFSEPSTLESERARPSANVTMATIEEGSSAWESRDGEVSFNRDLESYLFDAGNVPPSLGARSSTFLQQNEGLGPSHDIDLSSTTEADDTYLICSEEDRVESESAKQDITVLLVALRTNVLTVWMVLALACPILVSEIKTQRNISLGNLVSLVLAVVITGPILYLRHHFITHVGAKSAGKTSSHDVRVTMTTLSSPAIASNVALPSLAYGTEAVNGYDYEATQDRLRPSSRQKLGQRGSTLVPSVPYRSKHWTCGHLAGQRVAEADSRASRVLNMLNPHPRLQVMNPDPVEADQSCPEASLVSLDSSTGIGRRQSCAAPEIGIDMSADVQISQSSVFVPGRWPRALSPQGTPKRGSHANDSVLEIDRLTATLLPALVPGLTIGPEVIVRDDDAERTLRKEYSEYRREVTQAEEWYSFSQAQQDHASRCGYPSKAEPEIFGRGHRRQQRPRSSSVPAVRQLQSPESTHKRQQRSCSTIATHTRSATSGAPSAANEQAFTSGLDLAPPLPHYSPTAAHEEGMTSDDDSHLHSSGADSIPNGSWSIGGICAQVSDERIYEHPVSCSSPISQEPEQTAAVAIDTAIVEADETVDPEPAQRCVTPRSLADVLGFSSQSARPSNKAAKSLVRIALQDVTTADAQLACATPPSTSSHHRSVGGSSQLTSNLSSVPDEEMTLSPDATLERAATLETEIEREIAIIEMSEERSALPMDEMRMDEQNVNDECSTQHSSDSHETRVYYQQDMLQGQFLQASDWTPVEEYQYLEPVEEVTEEPTIAESSACSEESLPLIKYRHLPSSPCTPRLAGSSHGQETVSDLELDKANAARDGQRSQTWLQLHGLATPSSLASAASRSQFGWVDIIKKAANSSPRHVAASVVQQALGEAQCGTPARVIGLQSAFWGSSPPALSLQQIVATRQSTPRSIAPPVPDKDSHRSAETSCVDRTSDSDDESEWLEVAGDNPVARNSPHLTKRKMLLRLSNRLSATTWTTGSEYSQPSARNSFAKTPTGEKSDRRSSASLQSIFGRLSKRDRASMLTANNIELQQVAQVETSADKTAGSSHLQVPGSRQKSPRVPLPSPKALDMSFRSATAPSHRSKRSLAAKLTGIDSPASTQSRRSRDKHQSTSSSVAKRSPPEGRIHAATLATLLSDGSPVRDASKVRSQVQRLEWVLNGAGAVTSPGKPSPHAKHRVQRKGTKTKRRVAVVQAPGHFRLATPSPDKPQQQDAEWCDIEASNDYLTVRNGSAADDRNHRAAAELSKPRRKPPPVQDESLEAPKRKPLSPKKGNVQIAPRENIASAHGSKGKARSQMLRIYSAADAYNENVRPFCNT